MLSKYGVQHLARPKLIFLPFTDCERDCQILNDLSIYPTRRDHSLNDPRVLINVQKA
jgi:hypothetical protein